MEAKKGHNDYIQSLLNTYCLYIYIYINTTELTVLKYFTLRIYVV